MGEFIDLVDKAKKYYRFSPSEWMNIFVITLVLAFVISFREWGPGNTIDLSVGSINFLKAFLIVGLSVLVHISAQSLAALRGGFRMEYKMWTFGLAFALVLAFVSRGYFWVLISGGIMIFPIAVHRIGFFRYGSSSIAIGLSALAGPAANILLAVIFRLIWNYMPSAFIAKAVSFNVWYAVWSMLPIPGNAFTYHG